MVSITLQKTPVRTVYTVVIIILENISERTFSVLSTSIILGVPERTKELTSLWKVPKIIIYTDV